MKKTILQEAQEIIHGDREQTYGNPGVNLENIAALWTVFLEKRHNVIVSLAADDVAHMMIYMKMARLMHSPRHRDSLVDVAGYVGLVDKIDTHEKWLQNTPLFPPATPTSDDDDPRHLSPEAAVISAD